MSEDSKEVPDHHVPTSSSINSSTPERVQLPLLNVRKRKRKHSAASASVLAGSSSSSSDEEDETAATANGDPSKRNTTQQNDGWRVKLYRLNVDGSWDDCGTGRIICLYKTSATTTGDSPQEQLYQELGEPTLCMQSESSPQRVLLRTRILLRDAYQRQGDNIITWCEPYFEDPHTHQSQDGHPQGVDLALSFQDNAGCLDIWRQITQVQSRAAACFRTRGMLTKVNSMSTPSSNPETPQSVTDMAQAVAAAHHANLQRQQQHAMWVNVAEATQHHLQHALEDDEDTVEFCEQDPEVVAVNMAQAAAAGYGGSDLPNPPTLQNLEDVADLIAAAQPLPQRESLASFICQNDCAYLKALLLLFHPAEERQDYGALATLAACVKTILLLNDPTVIEFIVNDEKIYEQVCASLEYDPDLRDKANHRWFLRQRAKFRTVVPMEDEDLISTIHRSFRVTYLRDTLLRPTMDESSLSTLASLQTFTHTDVVKGVTCLPKDADIERDSYLVRVMRELGKEVKAISEIEWEQLASNQPVQRPESPPPTVVASKSNSSWKQYLAPQDGAIPSRRLRRKGCLSFFKELFNMVRLSLQQADKDDFYAAIVCMEVELAPSIEPSMGEDKSNVLPNIIPEMAVNLLSLLGAVLSDPTADATEKSDVLEIIGAIAIHDPSHIRRHSLEYHEIWKRNDRTGCSVISQRLRPSPNEHRQVIYMVPPNDIIASLLFLLAIETDAGLLLQTTEIMRIILDTDILSENGPMGQGVNVDDSEGMPAGIQGNPNAEKSSNPNVAETSGHETVQNQFLSLFYDHFVHWFVAPFQFTILRPSKRLPDTVLLAESRDPILTQMISVFKNGVASNNNLLVEVPPCANRGSFAVELLSFCVRAHLYRMKFFLLRSRVLGDVLKVLQPAASHATGGRCLKLAALRLLRSILSVKDEFYHRYIIDKDLFVPVFEAFRANPVGDNLVSSAIVEMCHFIQHQNLKSLIEYIVTRHLTNSTGIDGKSLEDVAIPYVSTLTTLRKAYVENMSNNSGKHANAAVGASNLVRSSISEKVLEDQRKFERADAEQSYFDSADPGNGET